MTGLILHSRALETGMTPSMLLKSHGYRTNATRRNAGPPASKYIPLAILLDNFGCTIIVLCSRMQVLSNVKERMLVRSKVW